MCTHVQYSYQVEVALTFFSNPNCLTYLITNGQTFRAKEAGYALPMNESGTPLSPKMGRLKSDWLMNRKKASSLAPGSELK